MDKGDLVNKLLDEKKITVVMYPSGACGEYLTQLVANHTASFNNIPSYSIQWNHNLNIPSNRYECQCIIPRLHYIGQLHERENKSNWINEEYYLTNDLDLTKNFVVRDHVDRTTIKLLTPIADKVNVLHIKFSSSYAYEYFATLYYAKTAHKLKTPVNPNFIKYRIGCSDDIAQKISDRIGLEYEWVWLNDIWSLYHKIINNDTAPYEHKKSIKDSITNFAKKYKENDYLLDNLRSKFNSYYTLDIDTLPKSADRIVKQLRILYRDFDIDTAKPELSNYINRNNVVYNSMRGGWGHL